MKAAAKEASEAPAQHAQHAPHGGDRRTSGADALRAESQSILAGRSADPRPDESEGTEAMVEADEQEAKTALHTGLEYAALQEEDTIDAHEDYVPDTETAEDIQALAQVAHQVARAGIVTAADEVHKDEKKRLYREHGEAAKGANAWRVSLQDMHERKRQGSQRGKILAAIMEVQDDATTQRRDDRESTEELFNETVAKDWMQWLFEGMTGHDATTQTLTSNEWLSRPPTKRTSTRFTLPARVANSGMSSSMSTGSGRSCGSETIRRRLLEARNVSPRLAPRCWADAKRAVPSICADGSAPIRHSK